ncbi:MAG: GNAT family N-acetyltransferase [Alphaproteobacteria bacterium]|nr:GNAT family N-acetyltransferase [Alphaproteobacteria bacterium]
MIPILSTPGHAADRADPLVMRHLGKGDTLDAEEAFKGFLSMAGHWALMGYGVWQIEEKETGRRIGVTGFSEKKRPPEHPASGAPEMGWSLSSSAHGKGYASEAVAAALVWARGHFGPGARVVAVISTGNDASVKVAQKNGFRQFATASRYGLGRFVFEREL